MAEMLKEALAVLSDPALPGSEKRSAHVIFDHGLFDGSWGEGAGLWSRDGARQTYQTTCIGISTHR